MNNTFEGIYNYLNSLHNYLDNKFRVSKEDRINAETNKYIKIINYLKDNRKLIGTILLILMIWYYYNYLLNCDYKIINIQSGGKKDSLGKRLFDGASEFKSSAQKGFGTSYRDRLKARRASTKLSAKSAGKYTGKKLGQAGDAIKAAPKKAKAYASKKVDTFKALSGQIYMVLFQLALLVIMFLVLGPTIFIGIAMIVCYSLFEKKIKVIKKY